MKKYLLLTIIALTLTGCDGKDEPDLEGNVEQLNKLPVPVAVAIELRLPLIILAVGYCINGGSTTVKTIVSKKE